MSYRLRTCTIFCLGFLWMSQAFSYNFTLKGKATGLSYDKVILSCPAWFDAREIDLQDDGSFVYYGSHPYPAMFSITYGTGFEMLRSDMFIFADIEIEVELISDPVTGEQVFLRLPSHRSSGFKKAKDFMDRHHMNKPTGLSSIQDIDGFIRGQSYIGDDSITDIYALSERLNYIYVLRHDYGYALDQVGPRVFDMEEFYDLPINKRKYLGFEGYRNLMVHYNLSTLSDPTYRNAELAQATPLEAIIDNLDAVKGKTPAVIYAEMTRLVLARYTYERLTDSEKSAYLGKLFELTGQYPNSPNLKKLRSELAQIVSSIESSPAPSFWLERAQGDSLSLMELMSGNNAVVIDVWGSWCKPCRVHNQRMKEVVAKSKAAGLPVKFVSIANESSRRDWYRAIEEDQMLWTQLRADKRFLSNYHIEQYPTVIIIDAQGVVKKVASSVSWSDIEKL